MSKLPTIRQMIDTVFQALSNSQLTYGHGTDNPWDEAIALVLQAMHLPFNANDKVLNRPLTETESQTILSLLDRRIREKIPLAYLTHEAYFAGMSFYVDERVLIPRSPIAELIDNSFAPWIKTENVAAILDMCTGSGCIAIACAKMFPHAKVDAVDLSDEALAVAAINIAKYQVTDKVSLIKSNLFADVPAKQYDIIVSNPPYVSHKEMGALPKEYIHEPDLALRAGDDGLEFVLRILRQAANYLSDHGILIVEVGKAQYALEQRLPKIPFLWFEFEHGGEGVFMLTAKQLKIAQLSFMYLDK
jgi:ribosomal protein L3 glutamine methyltransferase